MASVLEGFLVKLGFDVDQSGQSRFTSAVAGASKTVAGLAKAAVGVGVAMTAAFVKATKDVDKLYDKSRDTGASIRGFQAISRAVERVGGNAQDVEQAFGALADNIRKYGSSFESVLAEQVGVSLYDAKGETRDMADVFVDIQKRLSKIAQTDPGLAKAKADAIGLGGAFNDLMKADFPAELLRARRAGLAMGDSLDRNAERAHKMSNSLNRVWDTFSDGAHTFAMDVLETTGVDNWFNHLADKAETTIPAMLKTIKTGIEGIFNGEWTIGGVVKKVVEDRATEVGLANVDEGEESDNPELAAVLAKAREKQANTETVAEKAIKEQTKNQARAEAIMAGKSEKEADAIGEKAAQDYSDRIRTEKRARYAPEQKRVQIVTDDDGNEIEIPIAQPAPAAAPGKPAAAPAKPTAAPAPVPPKAPAVPTAEVKRVRAMQAEARAAAPAVPKAAKADDASDATRAIRALVDAEKRVTAAPAREAIERVGVERPQIGKTAPAQNRTVNLTQTINVQGAADPQRTAQEIARQTKEQVNRNAGSNVF